MDDQDNQRTALWLHQAANYVKGKNDILFIPPIKDADLFFPKTQRDLRNMKVTQTIQCLRILSLPTMEDNKKPRLVEEMRLAVALALGVPVVRGVKHGKVFIKDAMVGRG